MTPIALAVFGVAVLGAVCVPWAMLYRARGRVADAVLEAATLRGKYDTLNRAQSMALDRCVLLEEVNDDLTRRMREALVESRRCGEPGSALDRLKLLLETEEASDTVTGTIETVPDATVPTPTWLAEDDTV